jgi:hypothetical protein
MSTRRISIAKDFSTMPGARYRRNGKFSGEEFLETKLEPLFKDSSVSKIVIELDGTEGYATSFLEESFGGLARRHGIDPVLKRLEFISLEDEDLISEIQSYIRECNDGPAAE